MEKKNPIEEARRYVANAAEVIKKANYDPELKIYMESKYVKMAGDTLWKGCLIALDAVLPVRVGKGRPSVEKYKEAAAKRDRKLLAAIVPVMRRCTSTWATTEPGTGTSVIPALRRPTPSSTAAPSCILRRSARNRPLCHGCCQNFINVSRSQGSMLKKL